MSTRNENYDSLKNFEIAQSLSRRGNIFKTKNTHSYVAIKVLNAIQNSHNKMTIFGGTFFDFDDIQISESINL